MQKMLVVYFMEVQLTTVILKIATEVIFFCRHNNGVFHGSYMLNSALHKSEVSSDPIGACFCIDNAPNCSLKVRNITKYPGEDFFISATTVGQRSGDLQQTRRVSTSHSCANLTYTVFSTMKLS